MISVFMDVSYISTSRTEEILIQHDGTEEGIANRLVDMGVPKEDIVLAFHAPYKRKYTEFAVE